MIRMMIYDEGYYDAVSLAVRYTNVIIQVLKSNRNVTAISLPVETILSKKLFLGLPSARERLY